MPTEKTKSIKSTLAVYDAESFRCRSTSLRLESALIRRVVDSLAAIRYTFQKGNACAVSAFLLTVH